MTFHVVDVLLSQLGCERGITAFDTVRRNLLNELLRDMVDVLLAHSLVNRVVDRLDRHDLLIGAAALSRSETNESGVIVRCDPDLGVVFRMQVALIEGRENLILCRLNILQPEASKKAVLLKQDTFYDVIDEAHCFLVFVLIEHSGKRVAVDCRGDEMLFVIDYVHLVQKRFIVFRFLFFLVVS